MGLDAADTWRVAAGEKKDAGGCGQRASLRVEFKSNIQTPIIGHWALYVLDRLLERRYTLSRRHFLQLKQDKQKSGKEGQ